ncbi:MAG: alpha/beta hydrolase-fold protein [Ginsengibacter sp.]
MIKKVFYILILLNVMLVFYAKSQVKVSFQFDQIPQTHKGEKVFIAGSFNGWSPNNEIQSFAVDANHNNFTLVLPKGITEYKFTRGGWDKAEATTTGGDVSNRFLKIEKDTIIHVLVGGWKDDFASSKITKKHTASKQVSILDTAFAIPQLGRKRTIRIYLPKDYASSKHRYPVIYLHDGQNLFDEFDAGFGEWGVDEFLDSLPKRRQHCIVVGIDNGQMKRMSEYNPYPFRNFGKGEGDEYVTFLTKTLKPYIDKKFRTLSDKKNTVIAGSSMGGLISLYAVLKYPKVYGGAGIFSPAFWTASGIDNDVKKYASKINSRLFFYAGEKESDEMIPDMKRIEKIITSSSTHTAVKEVTDADAKHNEAAWRHYFPQFYEFMFPVKL